MYSPPVDRAATADDVKYAIERSLLPGVPNGYVQSYLSGVEGMLSGSKTSAQVMSDVQAAAAKAKKQLG